jgi:hypothetical protein
MNARSAQGIAWILVAIYFTLSVIGAWIITRYPCPLVFPEASSRP